MSMAFTDIRDTAAWRASFLQTVPWVLEPAYAGLVGFCLQQIYPDLLHVWNLGISRDLIGCVLKIILTNESVFSGPNIAARLQTATDSLRSFARRNGFHLKMKRLTKKKIMWASKKYPEFRGSGSDSHVVAVWLESVLSAHSDQFPDLCTVMVWKPHDESSLQCWQVLRCTGARNCSRAWPYLLPVVPEQSI